MVQKTWNGQVTGDVGLQCCGVAGMQCGRCATFYVFKDFRKMSLDPPSGPGGAFAKSSKPIFL